MEKGKKRSDGNGGRRWAIDSHRHFYFSRHSHCLNIQLLRRDDAGITVRAGVVPAAAGAREGQRVHPQPLLAPAGLSPRPPSACSVGTTRRSTSGRQALLVQDQYLLLKGIAFGHKFFGELESDIRRRIEDRLTPICCYMVAVLVFLGGSIFYRLSRSFCHLFSCHSHYLNIQLLRTDYVGIMVMIITSFFPPIYCIFQCEPHWQLIYLGGIPAMGMFTVVTLLAPSLSSGKFWAFQAMLFLSLGFFSIVPAIHACIVNWSDPQHPITLAYESAMALSYITGTLFYVSRIPERLKPGWSDLSGHSNQIFHIFVIIGELAHYGATQPTLLLLQWQDKSWVR